MSGLSLLQGVLRSALASQDAGGERRETYWLDDDRGLDDVRRGGGGGTGRRQTRRQYGGGRGSPPGGGGLPDSKFPTSSSRVRGLAKGGQSAVIKVVSFAAGGQRVGALAAYVTHEREGGVITEDQDGATLDQGAVAEMLDRWKQGFSERKPTKDVAAIRFDIKADPAQDAATIEIAVRHSLEGHHHALRTVVKGAGVFEVSAVVVAEGRSWTGDDGRTKRQARYKFDPKFETFIAGRIASETEAEVEATVTGTGHGRDGLAYRLGRLAAGAAARDKDGREVATEAHIRERANAWKKDLGSRTARDVMHLVVSAQAGTDGEAFRKTARAFFAAEFGDREYMFAVHNDRGHLHAHAMVQVRSSNGRRVNPNISTFSAWRSRYAELAQAHGIDMVATKRSDIAAAPPFTQGEAALVARGVAPDHVRRKVDAKRAGAIHVPLREEGRQRAREALEAWTSIEAKDAAPGAAERISDHVTRLSAAMNLSHPRQVLHLAPLSIIERGTSMPRATADYLTAEFNRTNQVLNRALPMLQGAEKVEATKLASDYLSSLAKQVEVVQALEEGQFAERAGALQAREERQAEHDSEQGLVLRSTANEIERNLPDAPPSDSRSAEAVALEAAAIEAANGASRERAEAAALSRAEQALRAKPASIPAEPDSPRDGEELREEQELLIDRIQAQQMTQGRIHRQ